MSYANSAATNQIHVFSCIFIDVIIISMKCFYVQLFMHAISIECFYERGSNINIISLLFYA